MERILLHPVITPDSNKLEDAYELATDLPCDAGELLILVPRRFQFDGASIPAPAWQLIGSPFHPRFMAAAVVHDWLYHTHQLKRKQADRLFYQLLLDNGINRIKALMMREAVENFGGWYWDNDEEDRDYLDRLASQIRAEGRNPQEYGLG